MAQIRNEKLEQDRKNAYYEKQNKLREKQEEERRAEEENMKKKREEARQKEMKYKKAYNDAKMIEESRCNAILEKERERDEMMEELRRKINKNHNIIKTRNYLRQLEKLENVERHQKSLQVYQSMVQEKIDRDEERTNEILTAKQRLLREVKIIITEQRKKQQQIAMVQKHTLHDAMERLRISNSFSKFQNTMR